MRLLHDRLAGIEFDVRNVYPWNFEGCSISNILNIIEMAQNSMAFVVAVVFRLLLPASFSFPLWKLVK